MNKGKYVFSQIMEVVSHKMFNACVDLYKGDYKSKHFSCWKQFLCMAFGQLTHRESLSDTILCLEANATKLYQLGIGKAVAKSTLSKANENRDHRIFLAVASILIEQAKKLYVGSNDLDIELQNNVFAIDATVIEVCLSAFDWAKFMPTVGGVKIHLQLDLKTSIPEFILITKAGIHDINFLDKITFQPYSFYVIDRGYTDFGRLYTIHKTDAYFIIRAKDNLNFSRIKSAAIKGDSGVLCDQTIRLNHFHAKKAFPVRLRRIKYYDAESDKTLIFLTNNFQIKATEVAQLYKHRWKIELFFKWIKQHLKIKSFWGRSENAVKTQIWIAIAVYVLVAILKKKFQIKQSLYEILQVISICVFDKAPLKELFDEPIQQDVKEQKDIQLKIF